MPVQLNKQTEKIHGGPINKKMVIKMVDYYRKNRRFADKSNLKFAHFTVSEVIDLLVANGIINKTTPLQQQTGLDAYGIKIYMANHANDPNSCPAGRETTYVDKDTVIICNTNLVAAAGKKTWNDLLNDDKNWITVLGAGNGLDKGGICPPDCPNKADPDGNYPVDISTVTP